MTTSVCPCTDDANCVHSLLFASAPFPLSARVFIWQPHAMPRKAVQQTNPVRKLERRVINSLWVWLLGDTQPGGGRVLLHSYFCFSPPRWKLISLPMSLSKEMCEAKGSGGPALYCASPSFPQLKERGNVEGENRLKLETEEWRTGEKVVIQQLYRPSIYRISPLWAGAYLYKYQKNRSVYRCQVGFYVRF